MVRRSKHSLTPLKVVLSLPCAAVLLVALAGAMVIPENAVAADLRLHIKPAEKQETPLERQKRLFDEFLRLRQQQKQ
jgi:hypothetical protein